MSKRTLTAVIVAVLLPGGGHYVLGHRRRAFAFFAIVTLLFCVGLAVDGRLYTVQSGNLLSVLATAGSMGSGLLYAAARLAGPHGNVTSITFEYGTAFVLTAGLMNLLLVLDSFDIGENRKS